ncbi:4589_t:CDS:2, partial [Funneliformis geosporum]
YYKSSNVFDFKTFSNHGSESQKTNSYTEWPSYLPEIQAVLERIGLSLSFKASGRAQRMRTNKSHFYVGYSTLS